MTLFLDTNALLNLQANAFKERFVISQKTLEEIENIKSSGHKDGEIKYKARQVSRLLNEHYGEYDVLPHTSEVDAVIEEKYLQITPDNIILATAYLYGKEHDVLVVSDDLNCKFISREVFKLETRGVDEINIVKDSQVYKGYKKISGDTQYINDYMMDCLEKDTWYMNEYLIIENTDDNSIKEMRFDGTKFVNLKLPPSKFIKGKNSLQRCALDALMNPDISIVAVNGGYGCGKTFLALQMALYAVREKGHQAKILGVREVLGEGEEIGFLKGDFSEKTDLFFKPLEQQLQGGEFELESLKAQGIIESMIPYFMKGTTYNETVIVCDEAEDFSEKQIKLVGTRLGKNSRIFFSGDYKQSVKNSTHRNSLVKMCNELKGNKKFACVYLGEDVRSETSKLFADLFENE